jgi:hypothetical protein
MDPMMELSDISVVEDVVGLVSVGAVGVSTAARRLECNDRYDVECNSGDCCCGTSYTIDDDDDVDAPSFMEATLTLFS